MADLSTALRTVAEDAAENPKVRELASEALSKGADSLATAGKAVDSLISSLADRGETAAATELAGAVRPAAEATTQGPAMDTARGFGPAYSGPVESPTPTSFPGVSGIESPSEYRYPGTASLPPQHLETVPFVGPEPFIRAAPIAGAAAIGAAAASDVGGTPPPETPPAGPTGPSAPTPAGPVGRGGVSDTEGRTETGKGKGEESVADTLDKISKGQPPAPGVSAHAGKFDPSDYDQGIDELKRQMDPDSDLAQKANITEKEKDSYHKDLDFIRKTMMEERKRLGWAEVAEMVGGALTRLAAAAYGLRKGVDLSGVQVAKSDWEPRRREIMEDFKTAVEIRTKEWEDRQREAHEAGRDIRSINERVAELRMHKGEAAARHAEAETQRAQMAEVHNQSAQIQRENAKTNLLVHLLTLDQSGELKRLDAASKAGKKLSDEEKIKTRNVAKAIGALTDYADPSLGLKAGARAALRRKAIDALGEADVPNGEDVVAKALEGAVTPGRFFGTNPAPEKVGAEIRKQIGAPTTTKVIYKDASGQTYKIPKANEAAFLTRMKDHSVSRVGEE